MNPLSGQKTWAALVLAGWMVTVVAVWGFAAGGQRALRTLPQVEPKVEPKVDCGHCDLEGRGIEIEVEKGPAVDRLLVKGEPTCPASCMRAGLLAGLREDTYLIIAYVVLTTALFGLAG